MTSHNRGVARNLRCIFQTIFALLAVTAANNAAQAATITVNTSGPPSTTKCSLMDAIQAATTNRRVHGCTAGQASTDTILLNASGSRTGVDTNATFYQNYGTYLLIPQAPGDGGPLVIRGGQANSVIVGQDYGVPDAFPPENCWNSAVYSGGSGVTIQNVILTSAIGHMTGVCQFAGTLTLIGIQIQALNAGGFSSQPVPFQIGAIVSVANMGPQTLTVDSSWVNDSQNDFLWAGGISLVGPVHATITNSSLNNNSYNGNDIVSAGGLWWDGSADLNVTGTSFVGNFAPGVGGGAMMLSCKSCSGSATMTNDYFAGNVANNSVGSCDVGAGSVYIDINGGNFPLTVSGSYFDASNYNCGGVQNLYMGNFYPSWQTWFSVSCNNSSQISDVAPGGTPYPAWMPFYPFVGDGTCQYM